MTNQTANNRRFVLTTDRVYVPGSLAKEADEASPQVSTGGCCGAAPSREESPGCGTSSCGTSSTAQQPISCC